MTDRHAPADPDRHELDALLTSIPEGWSRTEIDGRGWAITRTTHAQGKVITLSAERLGDAEQLSANVWLTSAGTVLKPCEVPAERVIRFLRAAADSYSVGPSGTGTPDRRPGRAAGGSGADQADSTA
ncbi:hypothetical protein [Microlunatus sp. Gsoil 973]|uniref:hypothetical protein n=1 Tax=Microlunatus sp. Gsoil 973 TaxID=2672569 RepID=UPI0012B4DCC7|nr:hypothetical protein [Microlunatus sp. Gsoil 973]QGN33227.1 hypothetical protein GJV80_10905 [Microlunatus sp. Gsoil 973]